MPTGLWLRTVADFTCSKMSIFNAKFMFATAFGCDLNLSAIYFVSWIVKFQMVTTWKNTCRNSLKFCLQAVFFAFKYFILNNKVGAETHTHTHTHVEPTACWLLWLQWLLSAMPKCVNEATIKYGQVNVSGGVLFSNAISISTQPNQRN